MEVPRQKCLRCRMNMTLDKFRKKRDDTYTKQCIECNEKCKKYVKRCEHGKVIYQCKECKGSSICEHNVASYRCKKCKGPGICEHDSIRSQCKECKGSAICEHNRQRHVCKECGGTSICPHNNEKNKCKECKGSGICEHDKRRQFCKDCGGASICQHQKIRTNCRDCKGSSFCEHDRFRFTCRVCDPTGYLMHNVRGRMNGALRKEKTKCTIDYLGCSIEEFKEHIGAQFEDEMTWENHGEWHIDHIIPLKYQNPTIEEVIDRLHWTNTQPLWAAENCSKKNLYIG